MKRRALAAALSATAVFGAGCAGEDPSGPGPGPPGEISLSTAGLPESDTHLGHLELWISFAEPRSALRHSTSASAGKFKLHGGEIVDLEYQPKTFALDTSDPEVPVDGTGQIRWSLAVDAFVTIEIEDDPDPDQPGTAFLGGSFLNGSAQLSIDHSDALGQSFSSAAGSFILETPTTSDGSDEDQGLWFTQPGGATGALSLPQLPTGGDWTYEAWISLNFAGVVSLGRFRSASGPDSDAAGPLDGSPPTDQAGYSFPGSDFPFGTSGVSMRDGSVLVTLEPADDPDHAAPFFLELLVAAVPAGQPTGQSRPLVATAGNLPTASITIPVD